MKNYKLTLSQGEYIEKVLERFRMHNAKPVSTPLASHFKLSKEMCPKTQEEIEYMSKVPYSSAVDNLMYAMVHKTKYYTCNGSCEQVYEQSR